MHEERQEWRYYNHAIIPNCAPHETPDLTPVLNGDIWKMIKGSSLFVRYTDDFDCDKPTGWWYIIKDTPFDINALKAKRRYEINKGKKYFCVRRINPGDYKDELYEVQVGAFAAYPEKYRPHVEKESFFKTIDTWNSFNVYGAFFRETGKLCGYSLLTKHGDKYIDFNVQKTIPEYEGYAVNAALVAAILEDNEAFLSNGGYICDGARSINHETNFQDYLEKYFQFRKAYCKLHIKYNPKIAWLIKMLYPFRKLTMKFDNIGVMHRVNSVLKMEEIMRNQNE